MTCFYGLRGQGKSLHAVKRIYQQFKIDPEIIVFTNCPLFLPDVNGKKLKQYYFEDIDTLEQFFRFAISCRGYLVNYNVLVFIDEANIVMPSRFFKKLPPYILSFLAQSRHFNVDVIYTTQAPIRVDKVMREITDEWIECHRMLFNWVYKTIETRIGIEGQLDGDPISQSFSFFPRKYQAMYDTHHPVSIPVNVDPNNVLLHEAYDFFSSMFETKDEERFWEKLRNYEETEKLKTLIPHLPKFKIEEKKPA